MHGADLVINAAELIYFGLVTLNMKFGLQHPILVSITVTIILLRLSIL
jgi:hypothetical protein